MELSMDCATNRLFDAFGGLAITASRGEQLHRHSAGLTGASHRKKAYPPGHNHYENTSHRSSGDIPSIHAERDALERYLRYHQTRHSSNAKIRRKLAKLTLLIARLSTHGDHAVASFKNSAPCHHCVALLRNYGVKKVIYTTDCGEPQRKKAESTR